MSSDISVRVRGLRKDYVLGVSNVTTVGELLTNAVRGRRPQRTTFSALTGIDLTLRAGESLGVVGHNGAGKSTLLKILSRITEPTAGRIEITGRVGALLEVGTGFHPELTGRENVFLNGSILGMRRREVAQRFDEIVDFSGVEEFLDLPVKRYSSGMSVRLAFAVASSLRSDVLIVDEVLAVGDAEFQRKCLGRMADVSDEGRTVIFVSHNLAAVEALCSRAVLLSHGQLEADGSPSEVIHAYLGSLTTTGLTSVPGLIDISRLDGEARPHLRTVEVRTDGHGATTDTLTVGGPATFDITVEGLDRLPLPHVGLSFTTETETLVATATTQMSPVRGPALQGDRRTYRLTIDHLPLIPGSYWIDVGVRSSGSDQYVDLAKRAFSVTVLGQDVYGSGVLPHHGEGVIYLDHRWTAGG